MLTLALITPAGRGSHAGNRATATRWAGLLRELGCRVRVIGPEAAPAGCRFDGKSPDLVMALHAWRSHGANLACRQAFPGCPLVVVLTGTDVYRFQHSHPDAFLESLAAADALIGLHDGLDEDLPSRVLPRLHVVHQSALPLPPGAPRPGRRQLDVLVVGHLREEKDPLRAALAVRDLPADSRLRVIQLGGAHDETWAQAARDEMAANPRYRWLGDLPRWRVRQWMARARLMVISSSRATAACWATTMPATSRSPIPRRCAACCSAPRPSRPSSRACAARWRPGRRCSRPRPSARRWQG